MGIMTRHLMANSAGLYPPVSGTQMTAAKRRRKPRAAQLAKRKRKKVAQKGRLVKGSRAAKAYMARIRRKRRK